MICYLLFLNFLNISFVNLIIFCFQSLDTPQYNIESGSSENNAAIEETSTNSLDQEAIDSNDRQLSSNNDTWQSSASNEEKNDLSASTPNLPDAASPSIEPPLKVPKLSTSENIWENSPSSQSSVEWHIPTSNSSSASEGAGESEIPETASSTTQNNVQSPSESSNCSLSRTSFNEGKEIQLSKVSKSEANNESVTETVDNNELGSNCTKDESIATKIEDDSATVDQTPKPEILDESNKIVDSTADPETKLPENSEKVIDEVENSPLSDEFWKKQNPLVDHVLITDVTKNHLTVTVRECDTSSGFFKDRPNGEGQNSSEEKEGNSL